MNSQFFTTIPCKTIPKLKALLPKHSDVQGVTYDPIADAITMHWSNEKMVTRYTHGNEMTVEQLEQLWKATKSKQG